MADSFTCIALTIKQGAACATGALPELNTSSVHCLVSPPPPNAPWTWKDGLYKVRDYLTHTANVWADRCSWPMRNNHFLLLALLEGLLTWALFQFHRAFLQLVIQTVLLYRGHFYDYRWACFKVSLADRVQQKVISPQQSRLLPFSKWNLYKNLWVHIL